MNATRPNTINLNLRLPNDLHQMLVEAAESASPRTSLNSEILARLYRSFDFAPRPGVTLEERYENAASSWLQTINEMQERLAELERKFSKDKR
jgi:hypothetical protein